MAGERSKHDPDALFNELSRRAAESAGLLVLSQDDGTPKVAALSAEGRLQFDPKTGVVFIPDVLRARAPSINGDEQEIVDGLRSIPKTYLWGSVLRVAKEFDLDILRRYAYGRQRCGSAPVAPCETEAPGRSRREERRRYRERHPEQRAAEHARWAAKNADHLAEYRRERNRAKPWLKREEKARRRALMAGATPEERAEIKALYRQAQENRNVRCYLCGELIPMGQRQVDHVIPLARGGEHSAANLAIVHGRCNATKGAKLNVRSDERFSDEKNEKHESVPGELRVRSDAQLSNAARTPSPEKERIERELKDRADAALSDGRNESRAGEEREPTEGEEGRFSDSSPTNEIHERLRKIPEIEATRDDGQLFAGLDLGLRQPDHDEGDGFEIVIERAGRVDEMTDIELDPIADRVIDALNAHSGVKAFRHVEGNRGHIRQRLREGLTEDELILIVEHKCAEWLGTEAQSYLRPVTLFGRTTHFDGYLAAAQRWDQQGRPAIRKRSGPLNPAIQDTLDLAGKLERGEISLPTRMQ